jgi:RNA polymerase sigma factor (sigma-70 family)
VPARGSVTPELLSRLLDEHGGALALYAAQWTDAADDCVQEALIELAGQRELPANPVAWLYRVVRNRAISQYRASRRREQREELAGRLRPRADDSAIESGVDPLDLAAALESLDELLREAVVARTWGGLGFEQIAELAGCSVSTAHRRYEAGLAALRERLQLTCRTNSPTTAKLRTT